MKPKTRPDPKLKPLLLLEDEPIPDHDFDYLKLNPFARIVAGTAVGTRGPFTIGVFADWGHGKTSVLRQAKSLIDADPNSEAVVTVWFNAWQYEREDHPIVPLLATIVAAVDTRRAELQANSTAAAKVTEATLSGLRKLSRALRAMAYGFSAKTKVGVPGFGEVEASFVAKEMIERYDQLTAEDRSDPLLMRSMYYNAFELLKGVTQDTHEESGNEKPPKIVVFVDDLDRCMPEQALHLLEGVKLALAQPGFIFALGVDRRIIESYLTKRYKDNYGVENYTGGSSYLDKIVQLSLYIPPHEERFEEYIKTLIGEKFDEGHADTREIRETLLLLAPLLAIGANHTPRTLVRLVNNLLVDARLSELTDSRTQSMKLADFLGLCAVSRSLQLHLSHDYRSLAENQGLCDDVSRAAQAGSFLDVLDSDGVGNDMPTMEQAEYAKRRYERELQQYSGLVASLQRKSFLVELFNNEYGQRWLAKPEERHAVDRFLAAQRGTESSRPGGSAKQIIDEAIRRTLSLPDSSPITTEVCRSVLELSLAATGIDDEGLQHLAHLTSLRSLDLSGTDVCNKGLRHLVPLQSLKQLSLWATLIDDEGLLYIASIKSLVSLDLMHTKIKGDGLRHLVSLKSLAFLDMSGTTILDGDLRHIAQVASLTSLDLSNTQIGDDGMLHLAPLESLEVLNLLYTKVSDAGLLHLLPLKNISWLELSRTQISDDGIKYLLSLSKLTSLRLVGTQITWKCIEYLNSMPSLDELVISKEFHEHVKGKGLHFDQRIRVSAI